MNGLEWVKNIKNVNTNIRRYAQFGEEAIFDSETVRPGVVDV